MGRVINIHKRCIVSIIIVFSRFITLYYISPATVVFDGSRFGCLGLWQQRWCDSPAPAIGKTLWCVSPFPPAEVEAYDIPSPELDIFPSPECRRHRSWDSDGHLNAISGFSDTDLAQLTFGGRHCCHDPGGLVRWCLFAKKLSTAGGQLVLCLHGNNFLFNRLSWESL